MRFIMCVCMAIMCMGSLSGCGKKPKLLDVHPQSYQQKSQNQGNDTQE